MLCRIWTGHEEGLAPRVTGERLGDASKCHQRLLLRVGIEFVAQRVEIAADQDVVERELAPRDPPRQPLRGGQILVDVGGEEQRERCCRTIGLGTGVGDAPERVGVIDDRWKEIRRHDQGAVVADLHDARILVGLEANKEIGVRGLLFVSQDLGEAAGINLGRSAATGGVVRKPDPSCDAHVFSREVRGRS